MFVEMFSEWIALVVILIVAAMSPGPDFIIAVRNGVFYSRRIGVFTAIGFALGVAVHVSYCLMGIATLISQSIIAFTLVKLLGAGYLFYIGYKSMRSEGMSMEDYARSQKEQGGASDSMTAMKALREGFITNLLNPKATLFFLSVFTQFVSPETTIAIQALYAATSILVIFAWFALVSMIFTQGKVRSIFLKFSKWVDRVCGGLFVLLGIKLATSKV